MLLKIENQRIASAAQILFDLPLKGKESRHRTKLIKLFEGRLKEVSEQEKDLLKEHCNLDEEGNPKTFDNGQKWDVKDPDEFTKDRIDLYEEKYVIDAGDIEETLKVVKSALENCDVVFSGKEADTYDYLCEALEEGEGE